MKLSLHDAIALYDPDIPVTSIKKMEGWDAFGGLGIDQWISFSGAPKPSAADLLEAADGRNLETMQHWIEHGSKIIRSDYGLVREMDYLAVRSKLKAIYDAKGWDGLTGEEKYIAAVNFICNQETELPQVLSLEERMERSDQYLQASIFTRRDLRMKKAKLLILNNMDQANYTRLNAFAAAQKVPGTSKSIEDLYVEIGWLGVANGDAAEGIMDFLENTPGTAYDPANASGLVSLEITTYGLPFLELKLAISNLLQNG